LFIASPVFESPALLVLLLAPDHPKRRGEAASVLFDGSTVASIPPESFTIAERMAALLEFPFTPKPGCSLAHDRNSDRVIALTGDGISTSSSRSSDPPSALLLPRLFLSRLSRFS
jgi:hypothetical protein